MIQKLDENFSELNSFLNSKNYSKIFLLVDENTHEYCLPILLGNLETDLSFEILEIEAGEEMKTIETAVQLWEILTEMNADRNALMINLGGGVISDLGGFIASTYKRGIDFINVPTTLLAMCDASIGGKTGIDLLHFKNMVGTFANPQRIFLYPEFLRTLPFEDLRSGFAEMLKHGLIKSEKHWNDLTAIDELSPENIFPFIEASMDIKQTVVEADFDEKSVRKILNFGHTIGHAIESLFLKQGKPIPHGEAVAIGMICETRLAFLDGLIDENTQKTAVDGISKFFPYADISSLDDAELYSLMLKDKKNVTDSPSFSLISSVGICNFDHKSSLENIILALDFYKNLDF